MVLGQLSGLVGGVTPGVTPASTSAVSCKARSEGKWTGTTEGTLAATCGDNRAGRRPDARQGTIGCECSAKPVTTSEGTSAGRCDASSAGTLTGMSQYTPMVSPEASFGVAFEQDGKVPHHLLKQRLEIGRDRRQGPGHIRAARTLTPAQD